MAPIDPKIQALAPKGVTFTKQLTRTVGDNKNASIFIGTNEEGKKVRYTQIDGEMKEIVATDTKGKNTYTTKKDFEDELFTRFGMTPEDFRERGMVAEYKHGKLVITQQGNRLSDAEVAQLEKNLEDKAKKLDAIVANEQHPAPKADDDQMKKDIEHSLDIALKIAKGELKSENKPVVEADKTPVEAPKDKKPAKPKTVIKRAPSVPIKKGTVSKEDEKKIEEVKVESKPLQSKYTAFNLGTKVALILSKEPVGPKDMTEALATISKLDDRQIISFMKAANKDIISKLANYKGTENTKYEIPRQEAALRILKAVSKRVPQRTSKEVVNTLINEMSGKDWKKHAASADYVLQDVLSKVNNTGNVQSGVKPQGASTPKPAPAPEAKNLENEKKYNNAVNNGKNLASKITAGDGSGLANAAKNIEARYLNGFLRGFASSKKTGTSRSSIMSTIKFSNAPENVKKEFALKILDAASKHNKIKGFTYNSYSIESLIQDVRKNGLTKENAVIIGQFLVKL